MIAAPVAFSRLGNKGVSVGISFGAWPSAPGAAPGQSGNGLVGCACIMVIQPQRAIVKTQVFIEETIAAGPETASYFPTERMPDGICKTALDRNCPGRFPGESPGLFSVPSPIAC